MPCQQLQNNYLQSNALFFIYAVLVTFMQRDIFAAVGSGRAKKT